jgi:hypothetical protein
MKKGGRGAPLPRLARRLALANQIPATARPHARGVHGVRRHIAAFTHAIRPPLGIHRQRHLSAQNDVRGFPSDACDRDKTRSAHLPDVRMAEAFLLEGSREFLFVNWMIQANAGQFEP